MVEGSRGRVVFVSNPSVTLNKVVNLNKRRGPYKKEASEGRVLKHVLDYSLFEIPWDLTLVLVKVWVLWRWSLEASRFLCV